MKRILGDGYELHHVLDLIEAEWRIDPGPQHGMPVASFLAARIRHELITCGDVKPHQIDDTSDIYGYFLPHESEAGSWQYAFADCLGCLLTYFSHPIGNLISADDHRYAAEALENLKRCAATLLTADASRFEARERVMAEKRAEALAPLAAFGEPFRDNSEKRREAGPVRKAITKILEKKPHDNSALWEKLKVKGALPKGWRVVANPSSPRNMWFIEGPTKAEECGYKRFTNVASEVRKALGLSLRKPRRSA